MSCRKTLGSQGEQWAASYLSKNKYKIIQKNFKTRIGEIDIIAMDKEYIVFIEVKTRTNDNFGLPCQAVDYRKQITIGKVAALYLVNNKLQNESCRFDIIEVCVDENNKHTISHIKDAFQPKVF